MRCCATLEGDTEAATFASEDDNADRTAGGTSVPDGSARPSADVTRIVSKPDVGCAAPVGLPGVGVVERRASSSGVNVAFEDGFGDLFPSFQDMILDATRPTVSEDERMVGDGKRRTNECEG